MSLELKEKIKVDLKRRNFTPNTIFDTIKNSFNGIKFYALDGKSILIYLLGVITEIALSIVYKIRFSH